MNRPLTLHASAAEMLFRPTAASLRAMLRRVDVQVEMHARGVMTSAGKRVQTGVPRR